MQRFQNEVVRGIANAPSYVRNTDLHRDLKMEMVTAEIRRFSRKHEERPLHHDSVEAIQLLESSELQRRLKRTNHMFRHPRCVFINYNWINQLSDTTI